MLNDIIKEQQEKAREELQGWLYNVVEHQIERDYLMRQLDTLITSTAQAAYEAGHKVQREQLLDRVKGMSWAAENETSDSIRILKELYDFLTPNDTI